jgi:cellobiose phosphorylase
VPVIYEQIPLRSGGPEAKAHRAIERTGDRRILDEAVPYDNEPGSESSPYEHLQRSLR